MVTRVYKINATTLLRHMRKAMKADVAQPRFKIGPYSFARWEVAGKPALYVSFHSPDSAVYLGRIQRNKLFPQVTFRLRRDLLPIRAFVENPQHAAMAVARGAERPVCACCDRPLGTRDVKHGIGETCMKQWGFK